jgi:hypothetical protein
MVNKTCWAPQAGVRAKKKSTKRARVKIENLKETFILKKDLHSLCLVLYFDKIFTGPFLGNVLIEPIAMFASKDKQAVLGQWQRYFTPARSSFYAGFRAWAARRLGKIDPKEEKPRNSEKE